MTSIGALWICIGAVMLLLEFAIPGVFICFFGIGAISTGIICLFFPGITLIWQLVIFAIAGTLYTLAGKKIFHGGVISEKLNTPDANDIVGSTATACESIAPDKDGKVELHGAFWAAASNEEIAPGTRVVIIERKGLILIVKKQ